MDLVRRASRLFGEVVVGIADSNARGRGSRPMSAWKWRARSPKSCRTCGSNAFSSLLLDFVRSQNASIILRGLRAVSDFEYEFQMAGMNRGMDPSIEVVFLTPSEKYMFISPPSCAKWPTSVAISSASCTLRCRNTGQAQGRGRKAEGA